MFFFVSQSGTGRAEQEAGRGFSVVADQIRKLAADSSQAAVNTKELIEKSLMEIGKGNDITNKTVYALNEILDIMKSFSSTIKGASMLSNNQAELLKQIEAEVEQISEVVQNNSSAAQETSATSEELLAQSENLRKLVEQFKLREK